MADNSAAAADDPTAKQAHHKDGKGSAVWREIKGLLWVLLAVLAFHSFVAKPFYIPSESMMPVRSRATGWWSANIPTAGRG